MNLIVICLDTFRADIVGGDQKLSFVRTPNLDDLFAQSVVFDRAFGEGQPTLQMRRAFFTGRRSFPWRHNFDRRGHWHHAAGWHKIPPDQDTLAEILTSRGYYTALVADTYHMFKPTMNYSRGFAALDFVRGQESDNWKPVNRAAIEGQMKRHVREPINWQRHATLAQYLSNMRGRKSEDDYLCARVFRSAADSLEDLAANAPFFLWIDSFDPHEPWDPPPSYADEYCPDYEGQDFIMPGAASEGQPAEPAELERIKALYFGECTFVDRRVGHLLEEAARLKLLDDTIVMVTCDHGTQVFDHGSAGKGGGNLRAYNTRIMWSVRHPDGPRGDHVSGLVQSHDLAPTALALLGIEYECDGEDVWPLVTGERDAIRDHIVIGWAGWSDGAAQGFAAVRDDRWSYTVPCGGDDVTGTLYDLQQDPEEDRDMAAERSGVVSLQRRRIERVMGQPLPGRFEEVCDTRAPSPYAAFLAARR